MPFEVGQFASDYEILGELGKGGMGRVYRVRNIISNRVEAMKILLADLVADPELGDRFTGEIRTLARLDHPNIAKFHTAFKVGNQLVMVMEFVEGFTLSDRAQQGLIPLNEVLSYITQVLAALGYAHQNGVIHRDIKPSNIMVTPHGIAKLMDFGIAKSNSEPLLTRPGTTMGSMLYMSPEQVRGTTIDARSDLYSVGVLLYELTVGRRPFQAENTYAILEAQLNVPPTPPLELNPSLPKALNDIIMTALAKDPMHRFQNAEAFRKALESTRGVSAQAATLTAASPVRSPHVPAIATSPADRKSKRALWMALGAVACICVLVAAAVALPHFLRSSASSQPNVTVQPPLAATHPSGGQPQPIQSQPIQPQTVRPEAARPEAVQPAPVNQPDKAVAQMASKMASAPRPAIRVPATTVSQSTAATASPVPPAQQHIPQQVSPPAPVQPAGPSQAEWEKVNDALIQIHSRADAVRSSLDRLRQEQAASGLGLRQDISASASRLDAYLQSADRAVQSNDFPSAQKYADHAEQEVTKLESFFGR